MPPPSATDANAAGIREVAEILQHFTEKSGNSGKRNQPRTVSLRVEQLGEARIFLQESEIFIVARMVAIFGPQLDRDFQILPWLIRLRQ